MANPKSNHDPETMVLLSAMGCMIILMGLLLMIVGSVAVAAARWAFS